MFAKIIIGCSCSGRVPDQLGGLLSDFEARRAYWDFEGVPGSTGKGNHSVRSPTKQMSKMKQIQD